MSVSIAWAAGLFEGEGTVFVAKTGYARAQMQLCDEATLRRFCQAVGVGKIIGPYKRKNPNASPFWCWGCYTEPQIRYLFGLLRPLLSKRRREQFAASLNMMSADDYRSLP